MKRLIRERAIVLRTVRYSDADLIVHALNSAGRRLSLLAKSALKSRRRFGGGVLQATHFIELAYTQKGAEVDGGLLFLEEARLLEDFAGVREDYERLETALYFLRVVGKVCQEGGVQDEETFNLLGHSLRAVSRSQKSALVKLLFEIKLLRAQGVLPEDFPTPAELSWPLKDHEKIPWEPDLIRQMEGKAHGLLQQYLVS